MHVLGTYRPFDTLPTPSLTQWPSWWLLRCCWPSPPPPEQSGYVPARRGRRSLASDSHLFPRAGLIPSCSLPWAMSWYTVSAGWAVQLVCYPIYADMSAHGPQAFHAYSHGYLSRWATAWGLPIGAMCLSWATLLWVPLRNVPGRLVWVIVGLRLAFAVVTPLAAIAQGHMFSEGFSQDQYARLMLWEDFRTAIFTLIGVLALVVMRRRLMSTKSRSA
jgi:hypothetical protein